MTSYPNLDRPETVPADLLPLFAPLHKRAFGMAVGVATGLLVFLLTLHHALFLNPETSLNIGLLSQFFAGYTVSVPGAFVGGFWGGVAGFVAGWFVAFCRNLVIAISMFLSRTRAELEATRDFLDHI